MDDLAKLYPVKSSLPCPSSHYMVNTLCWEQEILNHPVLAAAYLDCSDDAARFRFAENFLAKELKLEVQPRIVFRGKDIVRAKAARQSGNRLFAAGDLPGALAAYNECIINAPFKDKDCIVLALGNRSAVFFRLERYAECIRDIDQAVVLGYPLDSVKKLLMRKAKAFLAVGRPLDAVLVLEKEGSQLTVCSGSVNEICQLGGDMKDYSDLLALALRKQQEHDETSRVNGRSTTKPELKAKFPTASDKKEQMKILKLRGGNGRKFSSLSVSASLNCCHDSAKPSATFVANQDLDAGDVLLKEPAFVSAVHKRALLTNCIACLSWTDAPFPCSKCSVVIFCSPACANGPKAALHGRECSFWQTICLADEDEEKIVLPGRNQFHQTCLLAFRMMLTKPAKKWLAIVKEQLKTSSEPPTKWEERIYRENEVMDVLWLKSFAVAGKRPGTFKGKMSPRVALVSVYFVKVLESEYFHGITLDEQVRCHLGAIAMQALAICDRQSDFSKEMLGSSLDKYVTSSLVLQPIYSQCASSCDPNLIGVHYGDIFVIRARRPIRKGEALTVPYLSPYFAHMPREQRRLTLKSCGYAACQCRACVEEWPSLDKLEQEHLEGSCKAKCPFCSNFLGKFGLILERPQRLLKGCAKCKADGRALHSAVTTILKKYCLGSGSSVPYSDADTVDELFVRIRALRSICVEPSHVLVQADMRLERSILSGGNKRFDNVLPYPDQELLRSGAPSSGRQGSR